MVTAQTGPADLGVRYKLTLSRARVEHRPTNPRACARRLFNASVNLQSTFWALKLCNMYMQTNEHRSLKVITEANFTMAYQIVDRAML